MLHCNGGLRLAMIASVLAVALATGGITTNALWPRLTTAPTSTAKAPGTSTPTPYKSCTTYRTCVRLEIGCSAALIGVMKMRTMTTRTAL